jgi:hypothetical protein
MSEHLAGEITDWLEFLKALLVRGEVAGQEGYNRCSPGCGVGLKRTTHDWLDCSLDESIINSIGMRREHSPRCDIP